MSKLAEAELEQLYLKWTALGAEQERELIIKLLEEERLKHVPWCGKEDCLMCERTVGIERAIALIQGEQK